MNRGLAAVAAFLSVYGVIFVCGGLAVHVRAPMIVVLLSLFAFPLSYALARRFYIRSASAPHAPGRCPRFLFFVNFFVSDFLGLLNPFTLRFVGAQLLASILLRAASPISNPVRLQLPFEGTWFALAGGTTRRNSHSWMVVAQRYAYDFAIGQSCKQTTSSDTSHLAAYPAYGKAIHAPINGKVTAVNDTLADTLAPGSGWIDWWSTDPRGNHVLIEFQPNMFVLLAHLRPHSVAVTVGQHVDAGLKIGECGNSGRSTQPHLHLHCQRGPGLAFAIGLPIVFSGCCIEPAPDGAAMVDQTIQRGMQVRRAVSET